MSIKVAGLVRSRIIGSPALKAVLLNMADRANDDGAGVFSSKATIVAETEFDRATVFRAFNKLLSSGLIVPAGKRPCKNGFTVVYHLDLVAIAALPACKEGQKSGTAYKPYPSQSATPVVAQCDPDTSHTATPTGRTVRPKPSSEPSLEPSLKSPSENEGDGDTRVSVREEHEIDGWTERDLLDAVIKAAEADPGHRNWRSPAARKTVWGWLNHYDISPDELIEVIKGSRRGHSHELPNSPQAFIGDLETYVNIRQWNIDKAGGEYSPPTSALKRRRNLMRPPLPSAANIIAKLQTGGGEGDIPHFPG